MGEVCRDDAASKQVRQDDEAGGGRGAGEEVAVAARRGAPIIAEYLGGAASCDAYHLMDTRPVGRGAASCIRRSLEDVGVAPEEVNYVNAHATSSPVGDLAEVKALKKVFRNPAQIKTTKIRARIQMLHPLGLITEDG